MTILGIDPGVATTGYGVIQLNRGRAEAADYGCILTDKHERASARLAQLYDHVDQLVGQIQPDVVVVERLFFNTNTTTAMSVGQARGVILLAAEKQNIPIAEYTPLQVKMSVSGSGRASKLQVQKMITTLLKLDELPQPDDAADALAIAMCHMSALPMLRQKQVIKT